MFLCQILGDDEMLTKLLLKNQNIFLSKAANSYQQTFYLK